MKTYCLALDLKHDPALIAEYKRYHEPDVIWPEVLRSEIAQMNAFDSQVALPVRVVEPALKQGKIAFPWKVLRACVRPAIPPTVSPNDGMMLELPLQLPSRQADLSGYRFAIERFFQRLFHQPDGTPNLATVQPGAGQAAIELLVGRRAHRPHQ